MIRDCFAPSKRERKISFRPGIHTFLNGEEVTQYCYKADTRRGMVWLHKLRNGQPYVTERDEIAREVRYGKVRIVEDRR